MRVELLKGSSKTHVGINKMREIIRKGYLPIFLLTSFDTTLHHCNIHTTYFSRNSYKKKTIISDLYLKKNLYLTDIVQMKTNFRSDVQ